MFAIFLWRNYVFQDLDPIRIHKHCIYPPLLFREMYKEGVPDNKVVSVELAKRAELKKVMKRVMPFVAFVKEKVAEAGMAALDTSLPWDERTVLESNKDYIGQSCRLSNVTFFSLEAPAIVPGNMFKNVNVFSIHILKFFKQRNG